MQALTKEFMELDKAANNEDNSNAAKDANIEDAKRSS